MVGPTESNAVTWDGGGPKNGNRGEKTPTAKIRSLKRKARAKSKEKRKESLGQFFFFLLGQPEGE